MGSIDIIKLLSTVLSSAINKNQQYKAKKCWQCQESNPGLPGEKQVCYLCAMQPLIQLFFSPSNRRLRSSRKDFSELIFKSTRSTSDQNFGRNLGLTPPTLVFELLFFFSVWTSVLDSSEKSVLRNHQIDFNEFMKVGTKASCSN